MRAYEGMEDAIDRDEDMGYGVKKPEPEEGIDIHGKPVILVGAPRVWLTTENESPVYLTREDILELGFLRSRQDKEVYQQQDKSNIFLEVIYERDYSIKDFVVKHIYIYAIGFDGTARTKDYLYDSTKPNKEDIQQVIDSYAG